MITSTSNQQVKNLIQLQKKGKARKEQDVFVVEGLKMYQEAPEDRLVKTYVSESFYKKQKEKDIWKGEPIEILADRVFEAVSDTRTPQGILSLVTQSHFSLTEVAAGASPLLMVIENLQDPGNLGTILRTGEGAGVTGIIMSSETVDIYNPKTIRSTMGSLYRVPFAYVEKLSEAVELLQKNDIPVYAAHLKGQRFFDELSYEGGSAFLIGNEGNGLKKETADLADTYLKIPMEGKLESLNAAVAAALLLYQASGNSRRKQLK